MPSRMAERDSSDMECDEEATFGAEPWHRAAGAVRPTSEVKHPHPLVGLEATAMSMKQMSLIGEYH